MSARNFEAPPGLPAALRRARISRETLRRRLGELGLHVSRRLEAEEND